MDASRIELKQDRPLTADVKVTSVAPPASAKTWLTEAEARRNEGLSSALGSFHASRQFLTEGKLDASERLIRFYEGVAMSLQRDPSAEQLDACRRAFEAVVLYGQTTSDSKIEETQALENAEDALLRRQALHNLAVVNHRAWIQMQALAEKEKAKEKRDGARLKELAEAEKDCLEAAKKHYSRARAIDSPSSPMVKSQYRESLRKRHHAVFQASTLGLLEILAAQPAEAETEPAEGSGDWLTRKAEPTTDSQKGIDRKTRLIAALLKMGSRLLGRLIQEIKSEEIRELSKLAVERLIEQAKALDSPTSPEKPRGKQKAVNATIALAIKAEQKKLNVSGISKDDLKYAACFALDKALTDSLTDSFTDSLKATETQTEVEPSQSRQRG